jgi:hypothetical protein
MIKYPLLCLAIYFFAGCKKYEPYDFQSKCDDPNSTTFETYYLKIDNNLRYRLRIDKLPTDPKRELIRVIWIIEGKTFTGTTISYQFDKKGRNELQIDYYNRCLEKGTKSFILDIQ